MEKVILVDEKDNSVGEAEKLEAHKKGLLHRAFSIFIFNSKGELLLQKRAKAKYHSGGLWSNTCCSHPAPKKNILDEAHRRLKEEMGIDCELKEIYTFIYKAKLNNDLTEYEYDHVFAGRYDENPKPNSDEVEDWKWVNLDWLAEDIKNNPQNYTYWLKDCYRDVVEKIRGL
ncbi:MAG: isopentenyl-diphosphate Delta-isomerase [Parcubacteria group bacterium]|jgi:isopentenyl-diphosphate delta-isomerase